MISLAKKYPNNKIKDRERERELLIELKWLPNI